MLITNANLITWGMPNHLLSDHALWIEDGKIAAQVWRRSEEYPH